jgi:hypothetical protein
MSHARLYAVAAAALLLQGCGGDAMPAATPSTAAPSSAGQDLGTPESALAAVDQAERSIDRILGASVTATVAQSAGQSIPMAPPQAPPSPAPPWRADGDRPPAKDGRGLPETRRPLEAVPADACSTACSSLASMERATDHLCGLTGAEDGRCASARARAKGAAARVHAACPVCS